MVDEANEQYNDNEDALLEFVSMSDTHVASYESKKWAFQNIEDWSEEIGFHAQTKEKSSRGTVCASIQRWNS